MIVKDKSITSLILLSFVVSNVLNGEIEEPSMFLLLPLMISYGRR